MIVAVSGKLLRQRYEAWGTADTFCAVAAMACSLSWRPWPAYRWRQEHGRTIPLADLSKIGACAGPLLHP